VTKLETQNQALQINQDKQERIHSDLKQSYDRLLEDFNQIINNKPQIDNSLQGKLNDHVNKLQELEQSNKIFKETNINLQKINDQHQNSSIALKKEIDGHKDKHVEHLQSIQQLSLDLSNIQSKLQVLD